MIQYLTLRNMVSNFNFIARVSIQAFIFGLVLSSCSTTRQQVKVPVTSEPVVKPDPATVEPKNWQAQKVLRQQVQLWEVRGRLGVQTEVTGGSLDIIWKNAEQDFSIRLIAPLGAGTYLVQGNNEQAEIRYPNGTRKTINNIDKVFSSILDVDLPASAVKDWIRGMPAAALPVNTVLWNEKGYIKRVKQDGWNVEMTKYTGDKILMPHKIYLSREGQSDVEAEREIRLVIRQWLIDN